MKAPLFSACAVAGIAAALHLGIASAAPAAVLDEQQGAAAVGRLMQEWQGRILADKLPVEDAKNWARRNLAKFSQLNAEQIRMAQGATSLGELELVLMDAPVPNGTRLGVLLESKFSDISMIHAGAVPKNDPAAAPASYSNLTFTALTPCRILDSRISQGGAGPWPASATRTIKIGPYSTAGGGYATGPGAQGGSATSCGLDTLASTGEIAVIMAAVSTVSQAGAGYLTFWSAGAPSPSLAGVSQWYQPGYVQTSFVMIPTDLAGPVSASGFTSNATEVIIDVVGYFSRPTRTETLIASTHTCQRAVGYAAPYTDLDVFHAPVNSVSPMIGPTNSVSANADTNLQLNCPIDLRIPAGSSVQITAATMAYGDFSANCLVKVELATKSFLVSGFGSTFATVYSGTDATDFATTTSLGATKAFPAFVSPTITASTLLYAVVSFQKPSPGSYEQCRYGGVQLSYTMKGL